jgi:eukaryotic-like serine/threonine-protein kinase
MKKFDFWKADWFLSVLVTLLVLAAINSDLVQSLERKAYDLGVKATSRTPSDKVAVIAIDKQSIDNIGRWPWPREVHAKMTDILSGAKAKVISNSAFFFEPQIDPGLVYVNKLMEIYNGAGATGAPGARSAELERFGTVLREAEVALNADRILAASFTKAGNVLLPFVFEQFAEPQGNPDKPLPKYATDVSVPAVPRLTHGINPTFPVPGLAGAVAGMGHLNTLLDVDGAVRAEALLVRHYERAFPSLSMMVAARSLNLKLSDVKVLPDEAVQIGGLKIRTDDGMRMNTFFYSGKDGMSAFPVDSFFDVLTGKIPASKYQDKIVLIGPTAAGLGATQVTPISPATPPVLTMAHTVSSILGEHFFVAPSWGVWVERGVLLAVALYLIFALPRLNARFGAIATALLLIALVATHFGLMMTQLMWIQLMAAVTLLLVGHAALVTKRFIVTEKGKEKADVESAESNRMLGLAFQGQGQLDMAFDKFRKLQVDDGVMEILYNLALDFERKRQFNKAESVFNYMHGYNPKFRDLAERMSRARSMAETVILGGGGTHPGGTMALAGSGGEKPMLGRYQIEKELGKGAMGVVYLGKDPKIGRVVAIKTMALSQEFEADELVEVKERFFREAETAGRLAHPNIVTMYDAGEEHDLAYIAMEFLKGGDLAPYTKPDNLLPLPAVLSIIARVAEALGYAHQNNVVHRDVKPANVMYDAASDSVKVADFGIARITDSSKTKTGMVLGTPSYMSPEQLSGKKVEGLSDMFSLGVTLYQLVCGRLPFVGDSMAQLMFKIANEAHVDIRQHREGVPACVAAITNKALAKEPEQRYQSCDQMAKALRLCLSSLKAPIKPPVEAA